MASKKSPGNTVGSLTGFVRPSPDAKNTPAPPKPGRPSSMGPGPAKPAKPLTQQEKLKIISDSEPFFDP